MENIRRGNYYFECCKVLELDGNDNDIITKNNIKISFRRLLQKHHPDKGGNTEKCQKIIEAYTYLVKIITIEEEKKEKEKEKENIEIRNNNDINITPFDDIFKEFEFQSNVDGDNDNSNKNNFYNIAFRMIWKVFESPEWVSNLSSKIREFRQNINGNNNINWNLKSNFVNDDNKNNNSNNNNNVQTTTSLNMNMNMNTNTNSDYFHMKTQSSNRNQNFNNQNNDENYVFSFPNLFSYSNTQTYNSNQQIKYLDITLEDLYKSQRKLIDILRYVTCPKCKGFGYGGQNEKEHNIDDIYCLQCQGQQYIQESIVIEFDCVCELNNYDGKLKNSPIYSKDNSIILNLNEIPTTEIFISNCYCSTEYEETTKNAIKIQRYSQITNDIINQYDLYINLSITLLESLGNFDRQIDIFGNLIRLKYWNLIQNNEMLIAKHTGLPKFQNQNQRGDLYINFTIIYPDLDNNTTFNKKQFIADLIKIQQSQQESESLSQFNNDVIIITKIRTIKLERQR
jgi:DnaJ-class molecular chaperone